MGAEGALTAEMVGESVPRERLAACAGPSSREASVSGVTEIGVVGGQGGGGDEKEDGESTSQGLLQAL